MKKKLPVIGIIGLGSIGYTTLINYAARKHQTIGYDINIARIDEVNNNRVSIPGLEMWLDEPISQISKTGCIKATSSQIDFWNQKPEIIFIAIPTEKRGIPDNRIIESTFQWIMEWISKNSIRPILIVIESTMTPGTTDNIIIPIIEKHSLMLGIDLYLGVSPRRDWFRCGNKSIEEMERVYGGVTANCAVKTKEALGFVCKKLFQASNHAVAELTKCVENSLRQVAISLVNQFTLAFPDINMNEVMRLAATKWNINYYYPSLKVGGHCIPVAGRYMLNGSRRPEMLSILDATISNENNMLIDMVSKLKLMNINSILILGLSYMGNLKVSSHSTTISLIPILIDANINFKVVDPLYSLEELNIETDGNGINFEDIIDTFDCILLTAGHDEFSKLDVKNKIKHLKNLRLIIDNTGLWKEWTWEKKILRYYHIGEGNFIEMSTKD